MSRINKAEISRLDILLIADSGRHVDLIETTLQETAREASITTTEYTRQLGDVLQ